MLSLASLSGFKTYIYAGVGAVLLSLLVFSYVQHVELAGRDDRIKALTAELSVSGKSVSDLTESLKSVQADLEKKERADIMRQATVSANLRELEKKDTALKKVEASLRDRPSTSKCPIPKDLIDAWNTL